MAYDYTQAGYSPEVLDYVQGLDAQRNALIGKYAGQNVGLDNPDFLTPQQVQQDASDEIRTQYAPEDAVRAYMAQHPLNAQNELNAGVDVRSYGDSRDPSVYDTVRLPFGDDYTFTNRATGQTYNASTPEQLQAVRQAVSGLSTIGTAPMKDSNYGGGNNIANWDISNGAGDRVAYDSPYTPSFLKQAGQTIADIGRDYVLPAAFSYFGGPAGAVMGSFLSGTMQDKSTEDLALNAAIAGGTAYGMQQVGPYLNAGLVEAGLDPAYADMLFSPKDTGLFGKYSSGTSPYSVGGGGYNGPIAGPPGVEAVQVSGGGAYYPGAGALAGVLPAQLATSALGAGYQSYTNSQGVEEVNPSANKLKPFEIKPDLSVLAPPIAAATLASSLALPEAPTLPEAPAPAGSPSTLSQVLKYSPLALALLGAAGGSGGSSGSAIGGTGVYHAPEKLPDIFSAKLPSYGASALPSYAPATVNTASPARGNTGGAYAGEEDWYTYGRRPEKSFFSNIPGAPIGKAKGGSISARDAGQQTRSLAVRGPGTGRSFAVKGHGTGLSDSIPALLSDGEYVIDATTLALAGGGSNEAGARMFDNLRVDIRKDHGKELAKGKPSPPAKNLSVYMKRGAK